MDRDTEMRIETLETENLWLNDKVEQLQRENTYLEESCRIKSNEIFRLHGVIAELNDEIDELKMTIEKSKPKPPKPKVFVD